MLKAFDRSCFSSCATTSSSAGVEETETEDNFNDEDVSTDTLVLRFVAVVVAVVVVTEPDKSLCVCFTTFAVVAVVVLDALTVIFDLEIKGFDAFAEANIDDDDLEDLTDFIAFTEALGFIDFDDDDVSLCKQGQ
jgi:hypothetical protein